MLHDFKILDLTHFLAGPYCTMILAELGADVIRVEDSEHPDDARAMPPHRLGGESLYYLSLNAAKRSIALPLASERGRDSLAKRNPRIVSCSITGFGEDGPHARRAGYDYTVTALAGVQYLTTDPPTRPGVSYADHQAGLAAALAILAALLERSRTGRCSKCRSSATRASTQWPAGLPKSRRSLKTARRRSWAWIPRRCSGSSGSIPAR